MDEPAGGRAVRVAKNSLALIGADAAAKIGSLWVVGYLARKLQAEQYGLYQSAMAFVALFSVLGHIGLNTLVVREVARDRDGADRILGTAVLLKLGLTVLVVVCVGAFVVAGAFDALKGKVVLVALGVFFFDNILGTVRAGLQAFERMGVQAALELARKVLAWIAGVTVVYLGFKALGLAFAALAGAAVSLCLGILSLGRVTRLKFERPGPLARHLLLTALPLGVTSMLALVLGKIDMVMLSRMAGNESAGIYAAALAYQPLFIAQGMVWAVYPVLARMAGNELGATYRRVSKYLLCVALPAAAGALLVGERFLRYFLKFEEGQPYERSVVVFVIMACGLALQFFNMLAGHSLVVLGLEKRMAWLFGGAVVVNVCLNAAMIPPWRERGAIIATLATHAFLAVGFCVLNWRSVGPPVRLGALVRIIAATAVMAGCVYVVRDMLPLPAAMLVGAVVLGAALLGTGALDRRDKQLILKLARRS